MVRFISRIGIPMLLFAVAGAVAQQESDQLYFVGFESARGSISAPGQDETQVVLRCIRI